MTPKPESETDPWARLRRFHCATTYQEMLESPSGSFCLWAEADAVRAAEAAQHQQEIAAKDKQLEQERLVNNRLRLSWREDVDEERAKLNHTRARLAAVEAERDNLKGAMAADDARLRAAGERVDIQFGSDTADWMAEAILSLRAELDRLKAALSKITALDFEKFNGRHNFYSGAVMFVKAWLLAYAALTPHQGQSTDGETR